MLLLCPLLLCLPLLGKHLELLVVSRADRSNLQTMQACVDVGQCVSKGVGQHFQHVPFLLTGHVAARQS